MFDLNIEQSQIIYSLQLEKIKYDILYVKLIEPVYRPQNKNNEILFQTSVASLQSSESFIKSGVRFRKNLIGKGFDMAALCTIVAKCKFVDQVLNVVRK